MGQGMASSVACLRVVDFEARAIALRVLCRVAVALRASINARDTGVRADACAAMPAASICLAPYSLRIRPESGAFGASSRLRTPDSERTFGRGPEFDANLVSYFRKLC
jgi:hypothetical protein